MKDTLVKLLASLKALGGPLWAFFGKKLIVIIVGIVLNGIRVKFPGAPIPDQATLTELIMAFLACHTATDVAAVLKGASAQKIAMDALQSACDAAKKGEHAAAIAVLEGILKGQK